MAPFLSRGIVSQQAGHEPRHLFHHDTANPTTRPDLPNKDIFDFPSLTDKHRQAESSPVKGQKLPRNLSNDEEPEVPTKTTQLEEKVMHTTLVTSVAEPKQTPLAELSPGNIGAILGAKMSVMKAMNEELNSSGYDPEESISNIEQRPPVAKIDPAETISKIQERPPVAKEDPNKTTSSIQEHPPVAGRDPQSDLVAVVPSPQQPIPTELVQELWDIARSIDYARPPGGVTGAPPSPTDPAIKALNAKIAEAKRFTDDVPEQTDEVTATVLGEPTDVSEGLLRRGVENEANLDFVTSLKTSQRELEMDAKSAALINNRIRVGGGILHPRSEECTSIDCGMQKTDLAATLIGFTLLGAVLIALMVWASVKYGTWVCRKIRRARRARDGDRFRVIEGQTFGSATELVAQPEPAAAASQPRESGMNCGKH